MPLVAGLGCVLVLLVLAGAAIVVRRSPSGRRIIYAACLVVSSAACAGALAALVTGPADGTGLSLPLGLPWLGAHFRLDRLGAFFQLVVNLAVALASLYALGYAVEGSDRARLLPFYPAFLAGMNLVL